MDVLITLISQESTTWLTLHVLCSLEEEGKDEKSVNDTHSEPRPQGTAAGFTVPTPAAEIFLAASTSEES